MEFRPLQAACIFGAIATVPAVPFILLSTGRQPLVVAMLLVSVVISAVLFGVGAKLARTHHRIKSLLLSGLLVWTFSSSVSELVNYVPVGEMDKSILAAVASFTFALLAGWRLAPADKTENSGTHALARSAFVYFRRDEIQLAVKVRYQIIAALPPGCMVLNVTRHPEPPHPLPLFQISYSDEFSDRVREAIVENRASLRAFFPSNSEPLSVQLEDSALWAGEPIIADAARANG